MFLSDNQTLICCCIFLLVLLSSVLFLLSRSTCSSSSLMSASSFFFSLSPSALPFTSTSRLACRDSSALWWLFLTGGGERYYKDEVCVCVSLQTVKQGLMRQALPLKIKCYDLKEWREIKDRMKIEWQNIRAVGNKNSLENKTMTRCKQPYKAVERVENI